jgi:hypothetical protein
MAAGAASSQAKKTPLKAGFEILERGFREEGFNAQLQYRQLAGHRLFPFRSLV